LPCLVIDFQPCDIPYNNKYCYYICLQEKKGNGEQMSDDLTSNGYAFADRPKTSHDRLGYGGQAVRTRG